jgi:hypothetical protein
VAAAGVRVLLLALALGACATSPRFTPAEQPAGVRLAADYTIAGNTLRVWIESEGYRVEDVLILRPDGAVVRPLAIEPTSPGPGSGLSIGLGVGGSIGSGGGVSVGSGVGVGSGIGGGRPSHAVAVFPLDQAGPPPWSLHVKVVGIQPVVIVLPPERG